MYFLITHPINLGDKHLILTGTNITLSNLQFLVRALYFPSIVFVILSDEDVMGQRGYYGSPILQSLLVGTCLSSKYPCNYSFNLFT